MLSTLRRESATTANKTIAPVHKARCAELVVLLGETRACVIPLGGTALKDDCWLHGAPLRCPSPHITFLSASFHQRNDSMQRAFPAYKPAIIAPSLAGLVLRRFATFAVVHIPVQCFVWTMFCSTILEFVSFAAHSKLHRLLLWFQCTLTSICYGLL